MTHTIAFGIENSADRYKVLVQLLVNSVNETHIYILQYIRLIASHRAIKTDCSRMEHEHAAKHHIIS